MKKSYKVYVYISPKQDIFDPQGEAILSALNSLGFSEVKNVRVGKFIKLVVDVEESEHIDARVKKMCEKLLANPVIEDFAFHVEGDLC